MRFATFVVLSLGLAALAPARAQFVACQQLSDQYGIVHGQSFGDAPDSVRQLWQSQRCTATPAPDRVAALCQDLSDRYGASPGFAGTAPEQALRTFGVLGCGSTPTVNVAPHHADVMVSRLMDGNTNGFDAARSVQFIRGSIEFDLVRPYRVDRIVVHNSAEPAQRGAIDGWRVALSRTPCATPTLVAPVEPLAGAEPVYTRRFPDRPSGRYLCLSHPNATQHVVLAELEVFVPAEDAPFAAPRPNLARGGAPTNWARAGVARQSSTTHGGGAARAIDGNTNGAWNANSTTSTGARAGEWLEIALGAEVPVGAVVLHNRADCCAERLTGVTVELASMPCDAPGYAAHARTEGYPGTAPRHRFEFVSRPTARFVCVRQPRAQHLSVAEVEVLSPPPGGVAPNLALGKPAAQSSTAYGGQPAFLTDGRTDGRQESGTLSHTSNAPRQWMQVDLGRTEAVGSIVVHNRLNCCAERLDGAMVQLVDQPCAQVASQPGARLTVEARPFGSASPTETVELPPGARGRYVCLRHERAEFLTVSEIQVFPPLGAYGEAHLDRLPAVARLSSTDGAASADRALDGNTIGVGAVGSVVASDPKRRAPWFEVDLLRARHLREVVVHARRDDGTIQHTLESPGYLAPRIELALDPCDNPIRRVVRDQQIQILGRTYISGQSRPRFRIPFSDAPLARFVCIRRDNGFELSLAEVEVYEGLGFDNLARRGTARLSSVHAGAGADRAIDGWLDGNLGFGSVALSGRKDYQPWIEIDLGAAQPIGAVAVANRTDQDASWLVGARVEVATGPCADGGRRVLQTDVIQTRAQATVPDARTEFRYAEPLTARYVCVRKVCDAACLAEHSAKEAAADANAAAKSSFGGASKPLPPGRYALAVAEVQVFGTAVGEAQAPVALAVPPPAELEAIATRGSAPVAAPTATVERSGAVTTLRVSIAGVSEVTCTLTAAEGGYDMRCGEAPALRVTGTVTSDREFDLKSAPLRFPEVPRALFGARLAAGLDGVAEIVGDAVPLQLGLNAQDGFYLAGTLTAIGGANPLSDALRSVLGALGGFLPGFNAQPPFVIIPSVTGEQARLLVRLDVFDGCHGFGPIGGVDVGVRYQDGVIELTAAVGGASFASVTAGFSGDGLIKPTPRDPWLRFAPGLTLTGALGTGASGAVTVQGAISGACPASCTDPCTCRDACTAPWSPVGNPLFKLKRGYLEQGVSVSASSSTPLPLIKMSFAEASFGDVIGQFAWVFDYHNMDYALHFSAARMPLLGVFGALFKGVAGGLPGWLDLRDGAFSYASRDFQVGEVAIPKGFRVQGGLDLEPIGIRGAIASVLPAGPGAGTIAALAQGDLVAAAPDGVFRLSLDTSDVLGRVLALGSFSAGTRSVIERTLWVEGAEVRLGFGSHAAESGAQVRLVMFGARFDVDLDVASALDAARMALAVSVEVGRHVTNQVASAVGAAVKAGYDLAKEAADRVVAEVTSALASGRTVIVNGVITASSTVVAGATEAAESYLDWVPFL